MEGNTPQKRRKTPADNPGVMKHWDFEKNVVHPKDLNNKSPRNPTL